MEKLPGIGAVDVSLVAGQLWTLEKKNVVVEQLGLIVVASRRCSCMRSMMMIDDVAIV